MRAFISIVALASALASLEAHAAFGDPDPSYTGLPLISCGVIEPREDGGAYVGIVSGSGIGVERVDAHGVPISRFVGSAVTLFRAPTQSFVLQIIRGKNGDVFAVDSTGIAHIEAGGGTDHAYGDLGRVSLAGSVVSAAMQPDGKIVALTVIQGQYAFVRLNEQGFFDTSFGRSGTPFFIGAAPVPLESPYGWSVRSDGGVELGIYRDRFHEGTHLTPRLIVVGGDMVAQDAGSRLVPQGIATWMAPQAKVEPTGAMIIVGDPGQITRFNPDGSLDAAFGGTGVVGVIGVTNQSLDAFWREPSGEWTVLTHGLSNEGFRVYLDDWMRAQRYGADGVPDAAFGQKRLDGFHFGAHAVDGSMLMATNNCALARVLTDAPRTENDVVEYYHPVLDHYFMTSSANEIVDLDSNVQPGWIRTGESFGAWSPGHLPGAAHVCRFYGDPVIGPNSHFYTGEDFECDFLIQLDAATPKGVGAWHLEGRPFDIAIPSGGACPANLQPVYRVFNGIVGTVNGPNHRYTTNPAVYAAMQAKGWLPEGTHFCAPPRAN